MMIILSRDKYSINFKGLEMKINELLNESFSDDWDDEEEVPADPDQDKVPHLIMQFKKALDLRGKYPISFRDGDSVTIPTHIITQFMSKFSRLKPMYRERLQDIAIRSKDDFAKVLQSL